MRILSISLFYLALVFYCQCLSLLLLFLLFKLLWVFSILRLLVLFVLILGFLDQNPKSTSQGNKSDTSARRLIPADWTAARATGQYTFFIPPFISRRNVNHRCYCWKTRFIASLIRVIYTLLLIASKIAFFIVIKVLILTLISHCPNQSFFFLTSVNFHWNLDFFDCWNLHSKILLKIYFRSCRIFFSWLQ